jgi:hypothetical protein
MFVGPVTAHSDRLSLSLIKFGTLFPRNVYMVFSYFWFFVGLPMGFFSAILRILKAMVVGALMLPRIDHSVMPDGFQWFDRGN